MVVHFALLFILVDYFALLTKQIITQQHLEKPGQDYTVV